VPSSVAGSLHACLLHAPHFTRGLGQFEDRQEAHLSQVLVVPHRNLVIVILLPVMILYTVVPQVPLSLRHDVKYSLSPSIGGGDTIQYTPSNMTTPVTGVARIIVLAVEFDDQTFNLTVSDLNVIVFHRLSDYIATISLGKLRIEGKVAGIFRLSQMMSTYGTDNGLIDGDPATGVRTYQVVEDAIKVADSDVNFSDYQYLVVVHAGQGEEVNPKIAQNIWSVAFLGGVAFKTGEKSYDRAALVPETEGRNADVLGAYAHEFLHLLGLPDLYSTDDASTGDAGKWDVMARGLWNGNPPGSAPSHPTAWSKALLGWIEPEQIVEVDSGQNCTAYIDPVEQSSSNLKAVKIPLSESFYYMTEYRSRALDGGLPDEGVLITLIDLKGTASGGVMTIISTHGKSTNAPLKLGEHYANSARDLLISTRFSNGTMYGVDIIRGQYRTMEIKLPNSKTTMLVDGKPCTPANDGTTEIFVTPGSHTVAVPDIMMINAESRAIFDGWSDGVAGTERTVQITENVSLSVSYREQVLLSIASDGVPDTSYPSALEVNGMAFSFNDLSSVDTWIDLDRSANVTLLTQVVSVDDSTRYIFKGWSGTNSNSTLLSLVMSQPLNLVAQFRKQFFLNVKSEFGNPTGEGWYDNGTRATFNVTSPEYASATERYTFDSWSGSESKETQVSTVMDQPRTITAQWRRQLLVGISVLGSDGQQLPVDELKMRIEAPNGTEITQPLVGYAWLDDGLWIVETVEWMSVDVSPSERTYRPTDGKAWAIRPDLHTLTVSVSSRIFSRSISGITVCLELPDGEMYSSPSNQTGQMTITNLPSYEYYVRLARDGEEVSASRLYVIQDTKLEFRISDPFENVVIAAFAFTGIVSMTMIAMPSILSRLKRRRDRLDYAALDERVYEYIVSHGGIILKSKAARDLGISRGTLMRIIRRLSTKRENSLNGGPLRSPS
jgi:M6 family metalloprotease-like protein